MEKLERRALFASVMKALKPEVIKVSRKQKIARLASRLSVLLVKRPFFGSLNQLATHLHKTTKLHKQSRTSYWRHLQILEAYGFVKLQGDQIVIVNPEVTNG